jgi:uroporphyrinogen decarboxylase
MRIREGCSFRLEVRSGLGYHIFSMNSRELLREIIAGRAGPRCGFWLGNPHPDTWPILRCYFGTKTEEELRVKLGDDFRWISPQFQASTYRHPSGRKIFGLHDEKKSHGEAGPLAAAETAADVENGYEWPDPDFLDFTETLDMLRSAGGFYRASGFWAPFFHDVMDLFGMEHYFIKMHTHPDAVRAATARVCEFYLEGNRRFFAAAGDLIDASFFGNDFGTQTDCLISPVHFDAFVLPWFREFTDLAHRSGYRVILHSCGSVYRVIPRLLDAGVDALHPLQARAGRMEAERLSREFGGRLAFIGGIDTQRLLVEASPSQVKEEVRRLRGLFGPCWIVSPSHEAVLPNVPPENIAAMAEAAHEPF